MFARIFYRPDYQSDTTQFIQTLKAQRPSLEAEQRAGRNLLWDNAVDRQLGREFKSGRVPQQAYVYHNKA